MKSRTIVLYLFALFISEICFSQTNNNSAIKTPDYWPTAGWRKSTPEMQGMDSKALTKTIELALKKKIKIHSLQIVRNGYMVADVYFYPYINNTVHDMASTTKSVTSVLTGIAIDRGFIRDENIQVIELLPEFKNLYKGTDTLTLKHLLTMTSGFGQDAKASSLNYFSESNMLQMMQNDNWIEYIMGMPVTDKPGTKFQYNSCNFHLLSGILHKATGMTEAEFATENLFKPLGIKNYFWTEDPQQNSFGWGDLKLHPYDMAKIGFLMLQNGKWDNRQILSEEWIKKSTAVQVDLPDKKGPFNIDYGYGWWVLSGSLKGIYQATGRGGQYIIVWPEKNIVIVYTGGGFDAGILAENLLASLKSEQPLPENLKANKILQNTIAKAMEAPKIKTIQPTKSSITTTISGKTWQLEKHPLKFKSINLNFIDANHCEMTLKSEFFEFDKLSVHFDNTREISLNGKYNLPMYATAAWTSNNELLINVVEIANVNRYTIRLVFEPEKLVFGFIEKSMMNSEIILNGVL
jgi:CubicO group peptidase (beta-lactamase class C family)